MMKRNRNSLRKKQSLLRRAANPRSTSLVVEALESRELLSASPWQNPSNALDVYGGSGSPTPSDALAIINALNTNGGSFYLQSQGSSATPQVASNTPAPVTTTDPQGLYLDVLGTGEVTPADALQEINAINAEPAATSYEVGVTLQAVATNQFTASMPLTTSGSATATLNIGTSSDTLTITGDTQDESTSDLVTITQGGSTVNTIVSINSSGTGTATITNATQLATLATINAISGATISATNSGTGNSINGTFGGVTVTTVTPGETFDLVTYVQDTRSTPAGVYAAYTNVTLSNTSLASPAIAYAPPAGSVISNGVTTFTVTDASGDTQTFEFDLSGTSPQAGNVSIVYSASDSATQIGALMVSAINADSSLNSVTASQLSDGDVYLSSGSATGLTTAMVYYGPDYTNFKEGALSSGSIIDAGSGSTLSSGSPSNPGAVYGLWLDPITVSASASGTQTLTFTPSNSDPTGTQTAFDTLLYDDTTDPNGVVPPSSIDYVGTSVTVQGSVVSTPTVSISSASASNSTSGTTTLSFPVNITNQSSSAITVDYSTTNGTAIAGTDYTGVTNQQLVIPANTTVTSIPITILQAGASQVGELNKTFTLTISLPNGETGVTLASPTTVTGTIINTDFPTVSISNATTVNAPTTGYTFTVNLSQASQQTVTIPYTLAGTAVLGSDYTNVTNPGSTSGTLTFTPGQTSATVTLDILNNSANTTNPTVTLNLGTPTEATILSGAGTASVTILDVAGISAGNVTQAAPPAGSSTMVFTVNLPSSYWSTNTGTVQVNYTFGGSGDTAANGVDYTGTNNSLTFTTGQTSQTISVPISTQTEYEPNKTFTINLSLAQSYTGLSVSTPTVTGTITSGVSPPTVSISPDASNPTSLTASKTTGTSYVFDVTLSQAAAVSTVVDYSFAGSGTNPAQTGVQLGTPTTGAVTVAAGSTTAQIDVPILAATEYFAPSTFTVTLTSAKTGTSSSTITNGTSTGTIDSPYTAPTISVSSNPFADGTTSGTFEYPVTISLSAASLTPVTFNYSETNGPAPVNGVAAVGGPSLTTGVDYQTTTGSTTIAAGQTSVTIDVPVAGQPYYGLPKGFTFNVTNATNVSGNTSVSGTEVIDNEVAKPTISIANITQAVPSSGTTFNFTVTLSAPSTVATTVNYATANGTAVSPTNYTATSSTLTFNPGITSLTIPVTIPAQNLTNNLTFDVNLSSATNATISTATAIGTLLAYTPSSYSGCVFIDPNVVANPSGAATRSANEQAVENVTIALTGTNSLSNAAVSMSTTSASDGTFSFAGLLPGTYTMTETVPTGLVGATALVSGTVVGTNQISITIPSLGGVTATSDNFVFAGVSATSPYASQRGYLSSDANDPDPPPLVVTNNTTPTDTPQVVGTTSSSSSSSSTSTANSMASLLASSVSPAAVSPQVTAPSTSLPSNFVQNGSTLTITATGSNATFSFVAGSEDTVTYDGIVYQFDPATIKTIVYDGLGLGSATLTDTTGTATASVSPGSATLTGAGFSVTVNNVNAIAVNGTGSDKATLHDSALAGEFTAAGSLASLTTSAGQTASVNDFASVTLNTSGGGTLTKNVSAIDFALSEM